MSSPTQPTVKRVIRFTERRTKAQVEYDVTDADYLTMLRALEYEGPPETAVAWTLMQRFAYLYPLYPTLERFVKAYAQPINPDWFPDGKRHLAWLKKLRDAGKTAEADREARDAAKRPGHASLPLAKVRDKIVKVLDAVFLAGSQSPVVGSTHYRAPTVRTKDVSVAAKARAEFAMTHNMLDTVQIGDPRKENWFFSEPGAKSYSIQLYVSNITAVVCILGLSAIVFYMLKVGYA